MIAAYGFGMFQQQSAKMHMTPKLQQAIRILQLSTPDLLEYVRQELEENPLLEAVDVRWDAYSGASARPSRERMFDPLEHTADRYLSLEQHLKEQLFLVKSLSPSIKRIVGYIIGNLDHNGYLEMSLVEIAAALHTAPGDAEAALRIVQSLEPRGVGARDLKECLLLQLQDLPDYSPLVPRLISGYLHDIARYRIRTIAKELKVTQQAIEEAIRIIKRLDPRPGASYDSTETHYMVPDVIVEKAGDQFIVSIPDATVPRLAIHPSYEQMARESADKQEAKKFLSAKYHSAAFLIKCIEQRRITLLRVAQAIVEEQADFFRGGVSRLKPMILRQIAHKLNLHESTVSRATAGKYAQTPWGHYELTFFFPSGFNRGLLDEASAESVKEKIREWVGKEDGGKPYSDQRLADLLQQEGIAISRRTVTKYREQLGISSSFRRKRSPR